MLEQRLVFAQSIEGLFLRGLGGQLTPALKAKLRTEGLDLDAPLEPAYPVERWIQWVTLAARELHPDQDREQAKKQIGRRMIDGYFETALGRALLPLVRVLGPKRTLMRMRRNFRSGNNYTESSVTETGLTSIRLWMNEQAALHTFTQGILESGLERIGANELALNICESKPESVCFDVRWLP